MQANTNWNRTLQTNIQAVTNIQHDNMNAMFIV